MIYPSSGIEVGAIEGIVRNHDGNSDFAKYMSAEIKALEQIKSLIWQSFKKFEDEDERHKEEKRKLEYEVASIQDKCKHWSRMHADSESYCEQCGKEL